MGLQVNHVDQAIEIVLEHVPGARFALLTGSSARGSAATTSDLDIYVVIDGPPAPYRETVTHKGRLVELFVNTKTSLEQFSAKELEKRSPTTAHMCAHSIVILGDDEGEAVKAWAREVLEKGPTPLSTDEIDNERYAISGLIDDLMDATVLDEQLWTANELGRRVADFFLISHGNWTGRGKWLARRLHDADSDFAKKLADSYRQVADGQARALCELALSVLEPFGGYLQDGYTQGR